VALIVDIVLIVPIVRRDDRIVGVEVHSLSGCSPVWALNDIFYPQRLLIDLGVVDGEDVGLD
jgi:hypothetical protein